MDPLLDALSAWTPRTALVVGDFMLDQLVYGDAERLSPDAPVPILHVRRTENRPGGAANVCLDLVALRMRVLAFGVVGCDGHGELLRRELELGGVEASGVVEDASRPTTVKQNLIGLAQARHPQKMFRVDFESREPVAGEGAARLLGAFERALPSCDVVCIEDYAKGVCTPEVCAGVIRAARRAGKPVMVDPARGTDYSKYAGATVLTPNRTEAEDATGLSTRASAAIEDTEPLARALLERLGLEACVLTLDRHGALLVERGKGPVGVPTVARQVYDVTGAGDMFLAGLAAARANGLSWFESTRFANAAAGLEVEVFGVQPIALERVHHALLALASARHGKVRTLEQARVEAAALRSQGKRVVFTNGCFDILHSGHVTLLEKAAAEGDFLVVGLNDDASVRRLKGAGRPVNPALDRARVLGALASVGSVVLFEEDTPLRLIEAVRPDVLVKGADYTRDQVVGGSFVESYGGRVALVDLVEGKSTTRTIERLRG
ncbi:MAG: D-glycero-beta-D-manno-heptose 1-phosphate adenylyltransferase [Planctomycetota bacterium]|nr:D-glycero-beta-D-manno-heptose 1-phosphate adenylyltransferase [Planctomycetota bacterium]